MTDDDDRIGRFVLFWRERAAQWRADAQNFEEIAADQFPIDHLVLFAFAQYDLRLPMRQQPVKRLTSIPVIEVIRMGITVAAGAILIHFKGNDESSRLRHAWQR